MRLGNARGGGGIFTTASDLLRWNDALTNARFGAFVTAKIEERASLANGRPLNYARGLMLDGEGDDASIWHSGDAAGFNAVVVRVPRRALSLAVLSNAGKIADDENFEARIADLLLPPPQAEPGAEVKSMDVPAAELTSKAGLFFGDRGALRLGVGGGRLRIAGGPALIALDKDRYRNPRATMQFLSNAEFELLFSSADEFELRTKEGEVTKYRRAAPFAPSAAELAAFSGTYHTDEIGTFRIVVSGTALSVNINESPPLEFAPAHTDVFMRGMQSLTFERDAAGTITAVVLSNAAVRNVPFVKRRE
jgi:hypothetical protein